MGHPFLHGDLEAKGCVIERICQGCSHHRLFVFECLRDIILPVFHDIRIRFTIKLHLIDHSEPEISQFFGCKLHVSICGKLVECVFSVLAACLVIHVGAVVR
jgi:hypothetical protein